MKHKIITAEPNALDIHVTASDMERPKLLEGFRQCQSGQCGCPSGEYAKIESMDVDADESGIHIRLHAKDDAEIDTQEVEKCLAWAKDQAKGK